MSVVLNYGLLQYNYTDTNKIVINSTLSNTTPTLLQYLSSNNIPLVVTIPDTAGIFCQRQQDPNVFNVYLVYLDNESRQYISLYQYSLQWLNVIIG